MESVTSRRQVGKRSRAKGRAFEQLVVRILKATGHEDAERNLEYQSNRAGYDVHYHAGRKRVSCKCGRQVPVSVYAWLLNAGKAAHMQNDSVEWADVVLGDSTKCRLVYVQYEPGNSWVRRMIGSCDELWCKRSGDWPIVIIWR